MFIQEETISFNALLAMLRTTKAGHELKWTPAGYSNGRKIYTGNQIKIAWIYRFIDAADDTDVSLLYILQTDDGFVGYSEDVYGLQCGSGEACEDKRHVTDLFSATDDRLAESSVDPLPSINLNAIDLSVMIDDNSKLTPDHPTALNQITFPSIGIRLKNAV